MRQTLFFSATMPPEIASLASEMLRNPARVAVTPPASTVELIDQRAHPCRPRRQARTSRPGAGSIPGVDRALIFTRTSTAPMPSCGAPPTPRFGQCNAIADDGGRDGRLALARGRAPAELRSGERSAAWVCRLKRMGHDDSSISGHPKLHHTFTDGGPGGTAIAISIFAPDEVPFLRAIERAIRQQIPATASAGAVAPAAGAPIPTDAERPERQGRRRRRGGGGEGRQGEPRQHRQGHDRQAEGRTGQDRPAQGRPAQGRPARGKQTQKRNAPARHHGGDDIGADRLSRQAAPVAVRFGRSRGKSKGVLMAKEELLEFKGTVTEGFSRTAISG